MQITLRQHLLVLNIQTFEHFTPIIKVELHFLKQRSFFG